MLRRKVSWPQIAALGAISLLSACAPNPPPPHIVASNPPPISPGPNSIWYHVNFDTNAVAINADGQKVVADVAAYLAQNPGAVATIIGKTDTVGSNNYNMHLSHHRADAVRDALVYNGNVAANRLDTRWTGDTLERVTTGNDVASETNRVVDIAIH
jgi:outer membrane protein OmpA-like peptidoglycan-associated protein